MASPGKKSFPLRIDPALWAEIERLAAQELRSANAQVEYLLRQALVQRGRQLPPLPFEPPEPPELPESPRPDASSTAEE